ncbi:peptidoglycan-recognition protein LC-like [Trichogramma pretiosum]|uniref:peptidoglycan-recognition protein LC-like n=1 Tax=Trichogramma pretiosum TaxID=7493 RepID=UPI0006C9AA18|nr:peptidoglycan-recognition protein LC-like [Trichogramma pretiosum]
MSVSTDEVDDDNNDEKNVSTTSIASSSSSSSFDSSTGRESSLQLRQIHEIPREIGGVPLPRLEPADPAEFGSLVIKDSRGPHIGNTIIYEQPITIRQIVYANGTAAADSERDDVSSCASSVDEKRYYARKLSPTRIDKSDGFARAIGAMSIVIIVAVALGVTLLRSVSESVDKSVTESVNEPSDHAIVTTEVAVVDVPEHDEPSKPPPKEEEAISWLVNRTSWLARPARRTRPLARSPLPYLIVSETSDDRSGCLDGDSCRRAIRRRQLYDLDSLGLDDIGPSFLVGGDGNVYEGRGWWLAGQHTGPGYDERSLGLAFVGQSDSVQASSHRRQIEAARRFIELAVARGRLAENYRVYAEKQLRVGSTSPGERLYAAVKNWTHWSPVAPSIDDFL